MGKIVNINGHKMIMNEDGSLHKIPDKYYDINEMYSNNFAFKRPKKEEEKQDTKIDLFSGLDTKRVPKSTIVEKVLLNKTTLSFLNDNPTIENKLADDFGLHSVDFIINDEITDNIIYIYYDDQRYEVISIGNEFKKIKHFAERLLGDD